MSLGVATREIRIRINCCNSKDTVKLLRREGAGQPLRSQQASRRRLARRRRRDCPGGPYNGKTWSPAVPNAWHGLGSGGQIRLERLICVVSRLLPFCYPNGREGAGTLGTAIRETSYRSVLLWIERDANGRQLPNSKTGGRRFEPCHSCQLNQILSVIPKITSDPARSRPRGDRFGGHAFRFTG
ncbi:hypothetical protein ACVWVY_004781 [Bradyrhizobium sp. URHC0002]